MAHRPGRGRAKRDELTRAATWRPVFRPRQRAGSAPDVATRLMGEPLSTRWRQPVVVENRPAANGNLAARLVIAAERDGHTFRPGLHPVAEPVPDARDFGSRTVAGNPDDLAGFLGRERDIYRPLVRRSGRRWTDPKLRGELTA